MAVEHSLLNSSLLICAIAFEFLLRVFIAGYTSFDSSANSSSCWRRILLISITRFSLSFLLHPVQQRFCLQHCSLHFCCIYTKLSHLLFQWDRLMVFLGVLLIYALCSIESVPVIVFHCQLRCDDSFSFYSAFTLVSVSKKYFPHDLFLFISLYQI